MAHSILFNKLVQAEVDIAKYTIKLRYKPSWKVVFSLQERFEQAYALVKNPEYPRKLKKHELDDAYEIIDALERLEKWFVKEYEKLSL